MSKNIQQDIIINHLNQYLEWHNLPVRMNTRGICNGLASVYLKSILEDRQDHFFDILEMIASNKIAPEKQQQVDQFVIEVLLSFIPELFNQKLNQTQSTRALNIDTNALKSLFSFAITTSDNNWSEILATLQLQDQEALLIQSPNHTVTVSKKNNTYYIYDPNYSSGLKTFTTEAALIHELHRNVFEYNKGALGLIIQLLKHPSLIDEARSLPTPTDLYAKYLSKESIQDIAITNSEKVSTLNQAVLLDDPTIIEQLMGFGAKDDADFTTTASAIQNNCPRSLSILLKTMPANTSPSIIRGFFLTALENGREETFDILWSNPICKKIYDDSVSREYFAGEVIASAALSGNPSLLTKILNLDKKIKIPKVILQQDAIHEAIHSGSVACVKLLHEKIASSEYQPTDEQNLTYLLRAIKKNQPHIVSYFLEKVPKALLSTITMSTLAVKRTDLSILHELQDQGVHFGETSLGIIAQKEHQPIGILLTIGIMLITFSDYIKEILTKNESISCDDDKVRLFKTAINEHKSPTTVNQLNIT